MPEQRPGTAPLEPLPWVARRLPLGARITATVWLTFLLAVAVGVLATTATLTLQTRFRALTDLVATSDRVRSYRNEIDAMQFAAHRFVAADHRSAVAQIEDGYARTRRSLQQCLQTNCAGLQARGRIERLQTHLDDFRDAFRDAVRQRRRLIEIVDDRFLPEVDAIERSFPDSTTDRNALALRETLGFLRGSIALVARSAELRHIESLEGLFESVRHHSAMLDAPAETEARLEALRTRQGELLQRARGYVFLVSVVMAAESFEMRMLAERLEDATNAEIDALRASIEEELIRIGATLLLLLVVGSLTVLGVGRHVARTVTTPLEALAGVFGALREGSEDPVPRLSVHDDELADLTLAAERFRAENREHRELIDRYQSLNADLEAKVAERTHALQVSNRALETLATTDPLTGIANRQAISDALSRELERAQRYGQDCAVLFLDLDHFKAVNDRFGHETGDVVLRRFAALLCENIRACDRAGRWGGEEFLVLCPELDRTGARLVAERIREAVAGASFPGVGRVTASIGVAMRTDADGAEAIVARADAALYEAKRSGRNQVRVSAAEGASGEGLAT